MRSQKREKRKFLNAITTTTTVAACSLSLGVSTSFAGETPLEHMTLDEIVVTESAGADLSTTVGKKASKREEMLRFPMLSKMSRILL